METRVRCTFRSPSGNGERRIVDLLIRDYLLTKKPLRFNGLHRLVSTMFPSERGLLIYPTRIQFSAPAGRIEPGRAKGVSPAYGAANQVQAVGA